MSDFTLKRFYDMFKEEETSSSIKRRKTKNPDLLSSLPEELIVSMLSLLTAKEVAQTCVLSKRWRNLWSQVPSLCFDIRDFKGDVKRFENFVSNFLLNRDGTIDTPSFRIFYEGLQPLDCLDLVGGEWIKYAVKHNLKTLELSFTGCYCLDIPDCLFTCKTLEDVKLNLQGYRIQEIKPSAVSLPRLRNLDMTEVKFRDDNLEKLIAGCPILEDLTMKDCFLDLSSFSCHSVKQLQLLDPEIYSETMSISVPFVQTLFCSWDVDCKITLRNTEKVARAFWLNCSTADDEQYTYGLLRSLSGIEELEITSSCVQELLQGEMYKCPRFKHLKFLTIRDASVCCEFGAWTSFIKCCPHLEELYLRPDELCRVDGEYRHENLIQFERCSCKYLKMVGIIYDDLSYCVLHLESLIEEWTKEMKDVKIFLEKQV